MMCLDRASEIVRSKAIKVMLSFYFRQAFRSTSWNIQIKKKRVEISVKRIKFRGFEELAKGKNLLFPVTSSEVSKNI